MKKKGFVILAVIAILFSATTVYAYKKDLIKINEGKLSVFDITYNNVRKLDGNGTVEVKDNTDINLNTELNNPGDYTEYIIDIKNNSNKTAIIDTVEKEELSEQAKKYIDYYIEYLDGEKVKVGDIFKAGETKTAKIKVEYLKDVTPEDLPKEDENIKFSFNITMVEK